MIPNEIVKKVMDTASITEVIGEYVSLKKQGVNYNGCCPFHDEKTASFVVSPSKNMFKCFGCGKGGTVATFLEEKERISFPDAIKMLAKKYHIEIPEKEYSHAEREAMLQRKRDMDGYEKQCKSYQEALKNKSEAIDYLKKRGISDEEAKKWRLGWCDNGFFGNRLMFPIENVNSEVIAFTGRVLDKTLPKYKNSPESEFFHKGKVLYGLSKAKAHIIKHDKCYICEGQTDVIAMHRAEVQNTVCPGGTAFTVEQIRIIKRYTNNIVLIKDNDNAGIKSMLKNISDLLKEGINLKIVVLPEGEDPDSFIRKDAVHAKYWIPLNEIDMVVFKSQVYAKEIETEPFRRGEILSDIVNDISLVPDKYIRLSYTQKCAEIFSIHENELDKDVMKLVGTEKDDFKGKIFAFEVAKPHIIDEGEAMVSFDRERVIKEHLRTDCSLVGLNGEVDHKEIALLKKITKKINVIDKGLASFRDKQESASTVSLKKFFHAGFDIKMRDAEPQIDEETGEITDEQYINFVDWYIAGLISSIKQFDNQSINKAIENAAEIISHLPEAVRITKTTDIRNAFRNKGVAFSQGDFNKILKIQIKKTAEKTSEEVSGLSKDQYDDLETYQHYFDTKNNVIYHISDKGSHTRISNFIITPIIHSNTSSGHFKLFEIRNQFNLVKQISLETKDLNDIKRFKCAVESKGNFVFKGNQFQLDNIKERLYSKTTYSNEVECLGWQYEGFWAWADGITTEDGVFQNTDENGIIEFNGHNFLIKPYSNLYANDRTAYINEKKFFHKTCDVTFRQWSEQYIKVFGDNSILSICALLTAIYSDAIFKLVHNELPLINYFGPKGAGKTQQADSLMAFFGEKQPINNLSKVTIYGLSQTLKSFHNAFVLVDEYKNSLDMKWIEFLKSVYNRQGKIQGNMMKEGSKTEHIPINSMVLLCGQDLPTLDIALLDRCIGLTCSKTEFTNDEKNEYKALKDMEEKGFTHLADDFIKLRSFVIENFEVSNTYIQGEISKRCSHVSGRLQKNLNTILTPLHILMDKIDFPFTFDQALEYGCRTITEQQKFIESADDLRNFWTIFQTLLEQKRISEGRNYILTDEMELSLLGMSEPVQFGRSKPIMYVRWSGLYPLYAEYSRRSNMVALSEKTICFYLEKAKYYLGKVRSKKFCDRITKEEWVNNAYCFDYEAMNLDFSQTKYEDIERTNIQDEITGTEIINSRQMTIEPPPF